jgi:phosphohistidine swiveling domain-containing protein
MIADKIGSASDIEWCIDNFGKVWILQCRPITKNIFTQPVYPKFITVSQGYCTGKVRRININEYNMEKLDMDVDNFPNNGILVSDYTDAFFLPALMKSKAIINRQGNILSHSAIIAREQGIPCLVGAYELFDILKDDDIIEIDTYSNAIKINGVEYDKNIDKSDVNWAFLYFYERTFEIEVPNCRDNIIFEIHPGEVIMVYCNGTPQKELDRAELLIRRKCGMAPKQTANIAKYMLYLDWKRFWKLPIFVKFYEQFRSASIDFNSELIQNLYSEAKTVALALQQKNKSRISDLEKIYNKEQIWALYSILDSFFPQGLAIDIVYKEVFDTLNNIGCSFTEFLSPSFKTKSTRIKEIHNWITLVINLRNEIYTDWAGNGLVPRGDVLNQREDSVYEFMKTTKSDYPDSESLIREMYELFAAQNFCKK